MEGKAGGEMPRHAEVQDAWQLDGGSRHALAGAEDRCSARLRSESFNPYALRVASAAEKRRRPLIL